MKNYTTLLEKYQTHKIAQEQSSELFRNALIAIDDNNLEYRAFLLYLLFHARQEETTKNIIVDWKTISSVLGKPVNNHRGFNVKQFLDAFSYDVAHLEYSDTNPKLKQARTIITLQLPESILKAYDQELNSWYWDQPHVYTMSGKPVTANNQQKAMKEERNIILSLQTSNPLAQSLLVYLNSMSTRLFADLITKNSTKTLGEIMRLDDIRRVQQLRIFREILSDYIQLYQPTEKSVRLYPLGERIVSLKSEIRKTLTQGWYECDLQSSQFAIAAHLWNVPEVNEFLQTNRSIWEYLFDYIQTDKDTMKTTLYALIFGAGIKKLQSILGEIPVNKFLSVPLIQSLFVARNREIKRIKKNGGATTCFGDFLSVKQFSERSILAQLCQAMELKLLEPVIQMAIENTGSHGFKILLWQHDGFTWAPNDSVNMELWKERLTNAVEKQAKLLGITTVLS